MLEARRRDPSQEEENEAHICEEDFDDYAATETVIEVNLNTECFVEIERKFSEAKIEGNNDFNRETIGEEGGRETVGEESNEFCVGRESVCEADFQQEKNVGNLISNKLLYKTTPQISRLKTRVQFLPYARGRRLFGTAGVSRKTN